MYFIKIINFLTISIVICFGKPNNKFCGLPNDINNYPNYVNEQLQVIWKNYVPLTNCDTKLMLTQNVIRLHNDIIDHISEGNNEQSVVTNEKSSFIIESPKTAVAHASINMPIIDTIDNKNKEEQSYFFSNAGNYNSNGPTVPVATTGEDAPGPYLNPQQATFLQRVTPQVRDMFLRLFYDPDIPSESLRDHKLHMLAVSMLDADTLKMFDNWAVARRKALKDISASIPKKKRLA
uniref:Uncharacterized protein n=1 Tax=Parastrongyloides trichosuri TaxID=131310 RepID=A0A0N4ZCC1_PARTI